MTWREYKINHQSEKASIARSGTARSTATAGKQVGYAVGQAVI